VAARIVNKLHPEHAILCESLTVAEAKLDNLLKFFTSQGYAVIEEQEADSPIFKVSDPNERIIGLYYIEE
jgi:hypothetical protein